MEKTRIASPAPQGTHEARAARGTGQKPGSAEDAAIAAGQGGGFALLLAALGGGASEQASTQAGEQAGEQVGGAVALLDGLGTTAPEAGEQALKPQPGMPDGAALAPWMLGLQPTAVQAQGAGVVMDGAAATTGGEVAALSGLAGRSGQGLMGAAQAGTQRWTSGSLVGETAMLDGAAEAAALGGTSQGMGAAAPLGEGFGVQAQQRRVVERREVPARHRPPEHPSGDRPVRLIDPDFEERRPQHGPAAAPLWPAGRGGSLARVERSRRLFVIPLRNEDLRCRTPMF